MVGFIGEVGLDRFDLGFCCVVIVFGCVVGFGSVVCRLFVDVF